jgi:hypothetical protein
MLTTILLIKMNQKYLLGIDRGYLHPFEVFCVEIFWWAFIPRVTIMAGV